MNNAKHSRINFFAFATAFMVFSPAFSCFAGQDAAYKVATEIDPLIASNIDPSNDVKKKAASATAGSKRLATLQSNNFNYNIADYTRKCAKCGNIESSFGIGGEHFFCPSCGTKYED
jgi:hypothetical protein